MNEKLISEMEELLKKIEHIKYKNLDFYMKKVKLITKVLKDGDRALWGKYEAFKTIEMMKWIVIKNKA